MKYCIVITSPAVEVFGNFKKLCDKKGWTYQTLANTKKVPRVGQPVEIDGNVIHKVPKQ